MGGGQVSKRRKSREAACKKNAGKYDVCPTCYRKGMNAFIRKTYSKGRTWKKLWGVRYCQWCAELFPVEEKMEGEDEQ